MNHIRSLLCSKNCITTIYIIITEVTVLLFSWYKFKTGEINYRNSDATFHTLLTIQAYEDTPISEHKFLPLVNFGNPDDKFISWGDTIPDPKGNYFYTSFSWIGYFLPWAFIKLFHLPINETSLYIFNTTLFALSAILWLTLVSLFYRDNKNRYILIPIAALTFIFSPELMHGMGLVYWHQSILQVTLPAQMLAYYLWRKQNSMHAKRAFFALTLFNPLTEWTGYVANVGYACYEFLWHRKDASWHAWRTIFWIGGLTAAAFVLFTVHYLLVIPADQYFITVLRRFIGRSLIGKHQQLGALRENIFGGYIRSFFAWWLFIALLFFWILFRNNKLEIKPQSKAILFILAFLGLENALMQEHTIYYSYDRMKMVFLVSFISCELLDQLLNTSASSRKKWVCSLVFPAALVCCAINIYNYQKTTDYVWKIDYRANNIKFAEYIKNQFPESTLGSVIYVRGYINMLFHRSIYEKATLPQLTEIAQKQHKRYAIVLYFDGDYKWFLYQLSLPTYSLTWGMVRLTKATVYDLYAQTTQIVSISNDGIITQAALSDL